MKYLKTGKREPVFKYFKHFSSGLIWINEKLLKLSYAEDMKKDYFYIVGILIFVISIPIGIWIYDRSLKPGNLPSDTKEFVLTRVTIFPTRFFLIRS